jgi:hypothetical protein
VPARAPASGRPAPRATGRTGPGAPRRGSALGGSLTVVSPKLVALQSASPEPQEGEDIEHPDEVEEPQEQLQEPVVPKARRRRRTKAA